MKIAREGKLQQVLDEMGVKNPRSHEIPFALLVEHLSNAMHQQTHVDIEHRIAIGLVRAIAAAKGTAKKKRRNWMKFLAWFGVIVTLLAIIVTNAHAQAPSVNITRVGGTIISGTNPVDTGNQAFRVNCVTGCSAAASFADASAFTFNTTSISNISAVVDDVATNTVAENSAGAVRMNTNRILYVDLSKSAANTNKFLVTPDPITFASPQHVIADASSAVIGHVIADTGSTTAVTGNVTAVQPTGTNLHVVVDSGAVTTTPPSNASTNVAQFGGTNVSTGAGAGGAGIPRVTISNDSALAANQSVNVAQVAGATTSTAASGVQLVGIEGRAGTSMETTAGVLDQNLKNVGNAAVVTAASGVQKVGIVGNAGAAIDAAAGAALPANFIAIAGRDSTQTGGGAAIPLVCDKSAAVTATAAATVIVVALTASKTTRVCGFAITGAGAAGTMQWKSGTGTTCGTSTTNLTGAMATAIGGAVTYGSGWGLIFQTAAAAQDLCVTMATTSATAAGIITYAQF